MRIVEAVDIARAGRFPRTATWRRAVRDVEDAIGAMAWPEGSASFTLNPEPRIDQQGRKDKHPNGVVPLTRQIRRHIESRGWMAESLPTLPVGLEDSELLRTGDLDGLLSDRDRWVGFEWETGNVSSSHRAINKLLHGITRGTLNGGVLALPVRATSVLLTDRVGNFEELRPYFEFWRRYPVADGALRIYGVGHDDLDSSVPHIPKGKAGRALG